MPVRAQDADPCDQALTTSRDAFLRGRFEEARTRLEECLARDAFSDAEKPNVYKLLVRIYDADGLEEQVKRILAELLSLVPNYEPAPSDPPSFIQLVDQFKREINQAPVARLTAIPAGGEAPLAVRFDASASTDPDGTIIAYAWDFGDGATGGGATGDHTYTAAGRFSVRLRVSDDRGATDSTTTTVTVTTLPNEAPVARFDATPGTGEAPWRVALNATASDDPDGRIASYVWDLGDGETAAGPTVNHTFREPGVYTVELTVTDDDGARSTVARAFTVTEPSNRAPVARFDVNPVSGEAPLMVQFDASVSIDSDGVISSYAWEFGDGETGRGAVTTHTYEAPGAYTVELTVTDDDGAEALTMERVEVRPPTVAEPSGGGRRTWFLIGGGAVLAGAAGVLLSSGGGDDGGGNGGNGTTPIPLPPGRPGGN